MALPMIPVSSMVDKDSFGRPAEELTSSSVSLFDKSFASSK